MKRGRMTKRLFALALTLGMALSLAPSLTGTARAAGEGQLPQIIIKSNKFVSTPEDDAASSDSGLKKALETRFWAYQIFIGEIDEEDYVENRDINKLSGIQLPDSQGKAAIQWGASITNQDELLEALGDDDTPARDLGVTFVLMLETGERYLDEVKLRDYAVLYRSTEIWIDPNGEKTEQNLTSDGKAELEAAFNKVLNAAEGYLTIGELFNAAYKKNEEAGILVNGAATAAQVISDFTPATGNVALTQAFYAIVFAKELDTSSSEAVYKYLKNDSGEAIGAPDDNTDNKFEGAYAVSRWISNGTDGYWGIGEWDGSNINSSTNPNFLRAGYYMIRDAYSEAYDEDKNNIGKASAAYMAGVYGYGTIDPKAEAPSVAKTIANAGGSGASRELGEPITFTLEGSLPENYFTAYKGYPYIFEDTMAPGLDFVGITRVYVMVPDDDGKFGYLGAKYDYYLVEEAVNATGGNTGQGYRLTKPDTSNNNTLTISFPNLQNVKGKKVVPTVEDQWNTEDAVTDPIPVNNDSEVYVVYTAALNEDANIIDPNTGNRNTVVLRYANEPLWDPEALYEEGSWDNNWAEAPTGKVNETVYLYDFGVQLTVLDDGDNEEEIKRPLADACFALKKSDTNGDYSYAILHQVTIEDPDNSIPAKYTYYLAGWVSEDDLYDDYLSGDARTRGATRDWGAELEPDAKIGDFTVPAEGDYYAAVKTQSDGLVRIVGLKGNITYTLEEVVSPDDYSPAGDVTVNFSAIFQNGGVLTKLTAEATGADFEGGSGTILNEGVFEDSYKELVAQLIVDHDPGLDVDTGGMGTTLFYIGGSTLLAAAALLLIFSNVRGKSGKRGR